MSLDRFYRAITLFFVSVVSYLVRYPNRMDVAADLTGGECKLRKWSCRLSANLCPKSLSLANIGISEQQLGSNLDLVVSSFF